MDQGAGLVKGMTCDPRMFRLDPLPSNSKGLNMNEYEALKKSLAVGWNTWNTRSVLSHVLLPEAFALNLGIKEYSAGGKNTRNLSNAPSGTGQHCARSGARNSGYPDQDYWRGRIWAPMNFLVYLGMRNYDLSDARLDLVRKSAELLLKEWREHGHVHENYCGDTGQGCGKWNSDRFYHWGGLLGLISLIEAGYVQPPVGIKPVH